MLNSSCAQRISRNAVLELLTICTSLGISPSSFSISPDITITEPLLLPSNLHVAYAALFYNTQWLFLWTRN